MMPTHPVARTTRLRLEMLEDRAVPATFNVTTTQDVIDPADGKRSLREAITAANADPGADVVIVPAGVHKLALVGAAEDNNATGDFDITGSLTIRGAGAGLTIVEGQQLDRLFDIRGTGPGSIRVVLQGLTVRNGSATDDGGGIRVGNANLVARDCSITGNQASQFGGGISNASAPGTGNITLVRSTVARNIAGSVGGGISVSGAGSALSVRDSRVRRNVAGGGGGILASLATLTNSTVSGNTARSLSAGGISADTANLTNCTVSGNSASLEAGGIDAVTLNLTSSTVSGNSAASGSGGIRASAATLTNCTVSGNVASFGGGISSITATLTNCTVSGNTAGSAGGMFGGTANLTNCTVSGNTSRTDGGGIIATTATLLNCTVVENIAQTGGGIFHNPGGAFSVKNTLIALNLVGLGGAGPDVSGAFTSLGHNLIGNGAGGTGFTNGASGDIVGTGANPIDPKLGPLANNGGRTKTHALLAGSRAIDAGDNAGALATDQRGFPRKKDGNFDGVARVDIGAFEK